MTSRTWSDYGGLALSSADLNGIEHDLDIRVQLWQPNTPYTTLGQLVATPDGIMTVKTAHTSGGAYVNTNWSPVPGYIAASSKGQAGGVAALDGNGLVPVASLPTSAADYGYAYLGFSGNGAYLEKAQILFSADGKSVAPGGNNPVYTDPNTGASFRDPSLLRIGSTWFCAYTVNNGYSKNLGIIKSTDLTHWTQVTLVDVSAATSINQAWAPELTVDTNGDIYAFFTAVTAANAQSIWYVKATNPTGLTTWTAPVAMSWAASPGNIWDPTFVYSGGLWYQFYAFGGYIQRAFSATLTGTWTTDKTGDWAGWRAGLPANSNMEAPEIVQAVGSTYRIYFDPYVGTSAPYSQPGYYYSESSDLNTWTAPVLVAKANSFPAGSVLRHGAWVHLADDAGRNTALAAVTGKAQLQHVEYSGTFTAANAAVTNIGNPAISAANTNHDQFVTANGSGLYTFAAAGEYAIEASFAVTTGSGVSRTFAQIQNPGATITYVRTPGAAEDNFQLNVPNFRATAGQQILINAFQQSTGVSPATLSVTLRITRTSW